jgi:hypothetical protein
VPGFELFAMLGFGDFQGMLRGAVIWWLGSGVVDWWNENRSVPYVSSTRRVFFCMLSILQYSGEACGLFAAFWPRII